MLKFFKKYAEILLLLLLAVIVFYITYNPNYLFDTYLDIKAGQVLTQQGIIFHDVFSNSAYGRTWYPFQWLFQIGIYTLQHVAGMPMIAVFVSFFSAIIVLVFYYYLKQLFRLPAYLLAICSLFYILGISYYLVARATLLAGLFFVTTALLVLLYVLKNKNILWLLIPISLLWINMHASFIVLLFLLGSYAVLSLLLYRVEKEKVWLQKAKMLALYTVGIFLLSFSPPLYGSSYMVLWVFFKERQVIQKLVEWMPLIANTQQFVSYSIIVGISAVYGFIIRKKITRQDLILAIPLGFLLILPYVSYRNIVYGWMSLVIFIAFTLTKLQYADLKKLLIGVYIGVIALALGFYSQFNTSLLDKAYHPLYPVNGASFILKYQLKGNMYNNFAFGDYLLYRLYPQQKVFVDARADVYACCEYRELPSLINPYLSSDQYKQTFGKYIPQLFDKHHISLVVSTSDTYSLNDDSLLENNPTWSLVFWDDFAQIFVRRHDLNDNIIKEFGAVAAKPYDSSLYDHRHVAQAIEEYNRMVAISDSVKSRNSLAVIYIDHKDYADATKELQRAIEIAKTNPKAYTYLGYIAIQQKNLSQAFEYYKKAIQYNSDSALPYISVGELYVELYGDMNSAQNIWQEGLDKVTDPAGKARLTQLLNSN